MDLHVLAQSRCRGVGRRARRGPRIGNHWGSHERVPRLAVRSGARCLEQEPARRRINARSRRSRHRPRNLDAAVGVGGRVSDRRIAQRRVAPRRGPPFERHRRASGEAPCCERDRLGRRLEDRTATRQRRSALHHQDAPRDVRALVRAAAAGAVLAIIGGTGAVDAALRYRGTCRTPDGLLTGSRASRPNHLIVRIGIGRQPCRGQRNARVADRVADIVPQDLRITHMTLHRRMKRLAVDTVRMIVIGHETVEPRNTAALGVIHEARRMHH